MVRVLIRDMFATVGCRLIGAVLNIVLIIAFPKFAFAKCPNLPTYRCEKFSVRESQLVNQRCEGKIDVENDQKSSPTKPSWNADWLVILSCNGECQEPNRHFFGDLLPFCLDDQPRWTDARYIFVPRSENECSMGREEKLAEVKQRAKAIKVGQTWDEVISVFPHYSHPTGVRFSGQKENSHWSSFVGRFYEYPGVYIDIRFRVSKRQAYVTQTPRAFLGSEEEVMLSGHGRLFEKCIAVTPRGSADAEDKPSLPYIDEGACPFECCVYRNWTAKETIDAYREPKDAASVAFKIEKGDTLNAETGFVSTRECGIDKIVKPIALGYDKENKSGEPLLDLQPGDLLYTLHYDGEGYDIFWFEGKLYRDQIAREKPDSDPPPGNISFQVLSRPRSTWWVKVKRNDGEIGWVKDPYTSFRNSSTCD